MISSLLINFILFAVIGHFLNKVSRLDKALSIVVKAALWGAGVWIVATALGYLVTPLFFDHAEGAVAAVGAHWLNGGIIYTRIDDAQRTSILYGPFPYLISALFQILPLDPIFAAKLPGVLCVVIVALAAISLLRKAKTSASQMVLALCILAATLLAFYNMSYWNRPDSYLIAFTFLGFWIVRMDDGRGSWSAYLSLAVLTGLSVNCKLHGFLYFLPIVALFFESHRSVFSLVRSLAAVVLSLVVFVIPFSFSGIDIQQYFMWMSMATKHGLVAKDFLKNATYIGAFLLLLWVLQFHKKHTWTFIVSVVVGLLVALIASKPGSGAPHFLPLMPVFVWWALEQFQISDQIKRNKWAPVLGAFCVMLCLNAINKQKRVWVLFKETASRIEEYSDLKTMAAHLDKPAELVYTETTAYESSFAKVLLVRNGGGILFESSAMMDMKASSIDIPEATRLAIKTCKAPYFIFPTLGELWGLKNFYDNERLFDEAFVKEFYAHYRLKSKSEHYQLWECVN